jgi:hypothetical protein
LTGSEHRERRGRTPELPNLVWISHNYQNLGIIATD